MDHKSDAYKYYIPHGKPNRNLKGVVIRTPNVLATLAKIKQKELDCAAIDDYEKAAYYRDIAYRVR